MPFFPIITYICEHIYTMCVVHKLWVQFNSVALNAPLVETFSCRTASDKDGKELFQLSNSIKILSFVMNGINLIQLVKKKCVALFSKHLAHLLGLPFSRLVIPTLLTGLYDSIYVLALKEEQGRRLHLSWDLIIHIFSLMI